MDFFPGQGVVHVGSVPRRGVSRVHGSDLGDQLAPSLWCGVGAPGVSLEAREVSALTAPVSGHILIAAFFVWTHFVRIYSRAPNLGFSPGAAFLRVFSWVFLDFCSIRGSDDFASTNNRRRIYLKLPVQLAPKVRLFQKFVSVPTRPEQNLLSFLFF